MVTSYFGLEVEIWPFRACAVKNMQYNPYLWPNCQNFRILKEIGVEERFDDIRFKIRSANIAVLCTACTMKNMQYYRYYSNSSVIVNLAMGQLPCFTECISSFAHAAVLNFSGFCISATVITLLEHL